MNAKPTVLFLTGGPAFHPVADQVTFLQQRMSERYSIHGVGPAEFFDGLDTADLAVVGGLHWTGAGKVYCSPDGDQRARWRSYVSSGRPVCGFHGGIASFDDWPEFGKLLGFQWIWGYTAHSRIDHWRVKPTETGHPVAGDLKEFTVEDELYFNVCAQPGMDLQVHATADYHGIEFPMLITGCGGRCAGAGKTAYIANGHDLRAFSAPMLLLIFANAFHWLLADRQSEDHSIQS